MIKKIFLFFVFFIAFYEKTYSQFLVGKVLSKNQENLTQPLVGAILRWQNAVGGETSDEEGNFKIKKNALNHALIISLIGYKTDTLMVHSTDFLEIRLIEFSSNLNTVTVTSSSSQIDRLNPIQTEFLTIKTLKKAACCNLSESFETNASVSVSFADAITGSKQIQMLGLSGNYVQINTENIPNIRGLNTTFGLNYTPGTWITSIDIGKGAGSVVNGYESMAGAINVELIKPENADKAFINTYLNSQGRAELNVHLADTISKKWSVGLLTHTSSQIAKIDGNNDGFLDLPKYNQYNFINRWKYLGEKYTGQFGLKYLNENRIGGQTNFVPETDKNTINAYGFGSKTSRIEFFMKNALLFPNKPYMGLGWIVNALTHKNESYFGFKNYAGKQKSIYSNLIFQNIISNTNHTYKIGTSLLLDNYNEVFVDSTFKRAEIVPGIFTEYSFTIPEKFNILIGNRVDFHNLYGTKFTPRVHFKFDLTKYTQLRANFGKGWRVPNALAENFGYFVSSRNIIFKDKIKPEVSWNYGINMNNDFTIFDKKGTIIIDFYQTNFTNQLIVNMENTDKVIFSNLVGKSFSNSVQFELNYSPIQRFDLKIAYRNIDIKSDIMAENGLLTLLPKQFVSKDKILLNMAYAKKWNKWKYDFTWQWNGKRRIPNTEFGHLHLANSPLRYAPSYSNINAQISKVYKDWEFYLGGENLNNFKQKKPIIAWQSPFSKEFDASMVWGPIAGRMLYLGIRLKFF